MAVEYIKVIKSNILNVCTNTVTKITKRHCFGSQPASLIYSS